MRWAVDIWGTVVSFAIVDDDLEPALVGEAVDAAVSWFRRVDDLLSTWRPDSEIVRVGHGDLSLDDASPEVREVVNACDDLRDATGGAFDIGAGWRAGRTDRPGAAPLDPSGYVKGWAIERAALGMLLAGVASFSIGGGGDVVARGRSADGGPWRVGVQHPTRRDAVVAVLGVSGLGVATSGAYERGDHVVDPRTGEAAAGLLSATVVGPDLGVADAWATALLVAGPELVERLPVGEGYEALLVTPDDRLLSTPGLAALRVS